MRRELGGAKFPRQSSDLAGADGVKGRPGSFLAGGCGPPEICRIREVEREGLLPEFGGSRRVAVGPAPGGARSFENESSSSFLGG